MNAEESLNVEEIEVGLLTKQHALASLVSTLCPCCGKAKGPRKTFCNRCYFRLPQKLRNDLYKGINAGYVEAIQRAFAYGEAFTTFLLKPKREDGR